MPLSPQSSQFIRESLPGVSRTFALGISLLRDPLRDSVGLAYLVCRVLDTLEDVPTWPIAERVRLLDLSASKFESGAGLTDMGHHISRLASDAPINRPDGQLCINAPRVFQALCEMPPSTIQAICQPAAHMARGMAETLSRAEAGRAVELATEEELDQYCYYVAGTVGEMLTNLFLLDRPDWDAQVVSQIHRHSVDFGLGLQMVNVIKDVTEDFSRGVIYLPRNVLGIVDADLTSLLANPTGPAARQVIGRVAGRALGCLDAAMAYTLSIPSSERDIRLFCALPLLLALRTLGRAAADVTSFEAGKAPKIGRNEVSELHHAADSSVKSDSLLGGLIRKERQSALKALRLLLPNQGRGVLPELGYIGLGSNLGNRHTQMTQGLSVLAQNAPVRVLRESERLETDPVDCPVGSGSFVNSVVEISTCLSPQELVSALLAAERAVGRERTGERNEPRLLDLDLLLLGDQTNGWNGNQPMEDDCLVVVPHPRLHCRSFALAPLHQLVPELQHPVTRLSISEMLDQLRIQA